jgi:hypothetical protein
MSLEGLTQEEADSLVHDIGTRAGTAIQLAEWYDCTVDELREFVTIHKLAIELAKQEYEHPDIEQAADSVTPQQLDDLWITNKFQRLRRLQAITDLVYGELASTSWTDSTLLREFRSYLMLAANELGQLLHRGSGDAAEGDTVSYDFKGIDLDALK